MAFAAGFCVFPGGASTSATSTHDIGWVGPSPARVGAAARHRRGARAGPGVRRRTRDLRGVRRAARRPTADTVVADTTGEDWEADRRRLEARELSLHRRSSTGAGSAAHRPAAAVGLLGHPGLRAAALRHPVLRRRAARRPGHPRRVHRVRRGRVDGGARGDPRRRRAASCRCCRRRTARCLELFDSPTRPRCWPRRGRDRSADPAPGSGRRRGRLPPAPRPAGPARRGRGGAAGRCPAVSWAGGSLRRAGALRARPQPGHR